MPDQAWAGGTVAKSGSPLPRIGFCFDPLLLWGKTSLVQKQGGDGQERQRARVSQSRSSAEAVHSHCRFSGEPVSHDLVPAAIASRLHPCLPHRRSLLLGRPRCC